MIHLSQNNNHTDAAIYNNILVLNDGTILGVILGHCVFGWQGKVMAKYFKHTLYTLDGHILAKDSVNTDTLKADINSVLEKAWVLLRQIKDHSCPLIKPTEKWANIYLKDHFL